MAAILVWWHSLLVQQRHANAENKCCLEPVSPKVVYSAFLRKQILLGFTRVAYPVLEVNSLPPCCSYETVLPFPLSITL